MLARNSSIALLTLVTILLANTSPLLAVQTKVVHDDIGSCDPLSIPTDVDEIGDILIFPPDEALEAVHVITNSPVCPRTSDIAKKRPPK